MSPTTTDHDATLSHREIQRRGLVERYQRGDLPPGLEIAFEEHFFACRECQDELETARDFQRGLQRLVAEDAVRAVGAGLVAARLGRWLRTRGGAFTLVAGLVLVVAVAALAPVWWLSGRTARLEARLAESRQEALEWRRQAQDRGRSTTALEERLATSEEQLAAAQGTLEQLQSRLAELAAAVGEQATDAASGLGRPLADLPVFLLRTVRGGDEPPQVSAPPEAGALALAVDVGFDPRFVHYRARVLDGGLDSPAGGPEGGRVLYRAGNLQPNALEVLMLTFPADFLPPGEHRLVVEGITEDGAAVLVGTYPFRVPG